jgi:hypothetical protein
MNSHLATEVFNYEKATILNDCVCRRVNHMTLAIGQEYDARKLIYNIGNSRHIIASEAKRQVLPCFSSALRTEVIASSLREMHRKAPGNAAMAPRSTTEAGDVKT